MPTDATQPAPPATDPFAEERIAFEQRLAALEVELQAALARVTPAPETPPAPYVDPTIDPEDGLPYRYVRPTDTWESLAARFGVEPAAMFAVNAGLGGCTTMQSVPVGQIVYLPDGAVVQPAKIEE